MVPPPRLPPPSPRVMPAGIAGAVSFSLTFATVVAAEVKAKERPPTDLLPQNVVLYQYQACPFCNKVRGESSFPLLQSRDSGIYLSDLRHVWN
jgi:microsomal prostaglandin-E synthase 2